MQIKAELKRGLGYLLIFLFALPGGAELRAGAGSCEVVPPIDKWKVTLGGYGARNKKPATGVHDPIYAKALVFESEGEKIAIAVIDLVEVSDEIRTAVLERLKGSDFGDQNLLLTATHTHSAPGAVEKIIVASLIFGKYSQKVVDLIADGVVNAIKQAEANLQPAVVKIAQKQVPGLTRNRRVPAYNYDTRRFSTPFDPAHPEGTTDNTITVLRVDNSKGEPIAILVHLATHATVLGADNFLISADWPGVMRREIKSHYPSAEVIFMNGAEGDQAPNITTQDDPDDFKCLEQFGKKVAKSVLPLIESAKPITAEPIKFQLERRWVNAQPKLMGIPISKTLAKHWLGEMPFGAVRLGEVIFLGLPIEAISEIGWTIKLSARGYGYKYPIVAGLANGHFLYCTTPEEYKKGGYEAQNTIWGEIEYDILIGESLSLARKLAK